MHASRTRLIPKLTAMILAAALVAGTPALGDVGELKPLPPEQGANVAKETPTEFPIKTGSPQPSAPVVIAQQAEIVRSDEEDEPESTTTDKELQDEAVGQRDDSMNLSTPPGYESVTRPGIVITPGSSYGTSTVRKPPDLSSRIRKLGESTITREVEDPSIEEVPEQIFLYPPPPTIYGEEIDPEEFCCGINGSVITYPITADWLEPPEELVAPRSPAVGAFQVMLHDGGYFQNERDMQVQSAAISINLYRHYNSDIKARSGGLIGHGWDFSYNKRIVSIGARQMGNGLWAEIAGADTPKLYFYNGHGRAELYKGKHSEIRQNIQNFDTVFKAYVTTYESPGGQFHEIQRYIMMAGEHPFRDHINVEDTEQIFFVLREKNGTRYVFNCRGQLLYILSRHHTKDSPVRVELRYEGPISPLTHSTTLSAIIDTVDRTYTVKTVLIGQGTYLTNIKCQMVSGSLPIPRIKSISGQGIEIEYIYQGGDTDPTLVEMKRTMGDVVQVTKYGYDPKKRLTTVTSPVESAAGGQPYIVNEYDGEDRVVSQQMGEMRMRIAYGPKVTVTDAGGTQKQYTLKKIGDFRVAAEVVQKGGGSGGGGSWTTKYSHNDSTQVTTITRPKGNSIEYKYDGDNAPVTKGPIRNWEEKGWTYENDLSKGNLLGVAYHGDEGTLETSQKYEPLFNQTSESVDPRGNKTTYTFEYSAFKNFGNAMTRQSPDRKRPDGGVIKPPKTTFEYNVRGQIVKFDAGNGKVTTFAYLSSGYLKSITHPSGAVETFTVNKRGQVKEEGGTAGTTRFKLDGRGRVVEKVRDPGGFANKISYKYDLNDNIIETRVEVKDNFAGTNASRRRLRSRGRRDMVVVAKFDILNRMTRETQKGSGTTIERTTTYGSRGEIKSTSKPSPAGSGTVTTKFEYDGRGLVVSQTEAEGTGAAITTKYDYDKNGNLTKIDRGGIDTSKIDFDGFDRAVKTTNAVGTTFEQTLDKSGNVTKLEIKGNSGATGGGRKTLFKGEYQIDAYNKVVSKKIHRLTGGGPSTTKWFYDAEGNIEYVRGPNGADYSFEYDSDNRVTSVTDPMGNKTVNTYDLAGNKTQIVQNEDEQNWSRGKNDFVSRTGAYTWTYKYDALGRLTAQSGPEVESENFYNSIDQVRGTYNRNSGLTEFRFDGLNRKTSLRHGEFWQRFAYNAAGLYTEVESPRQSERFAYDAMGRMVTRTNGKTGGVTKTEYDAMGRARKTTDANGTMTWRTFDAAGLPTKVQINYGRTLIQVGGRNIPAASGMRSLTFRYDGLQRITRAATNQDSIVTYEYDGQGRAIKEQQIYSGSGQTVQRSYADDLSWVETRYPELTGKPKVRKWYDNLGRVESVTVDGDQIASYLYSGTDRVAMRQAGNGVNTLYQYDSARRLTNISVTTGRLGGTQNHLWNARATYTRGRPETVVEHFYGNATAPATVMETRFGHDTMGRRLVTTTKNSSLPFNGRPASVGESANFSEFVDGRMARMSEYLLNSQQSVLSMVRTDSFKYNAAGQVASVATTVRRNVKREKLLLNSAATVGGVAKAGGEAIRDTQKFRYDSNGNLIADGRFVYSYDYQNRLTRIEDTWSPYGYRERVTFIYDAFGRRILSYPTRDRVPGGLVQWAPDWKRTRYPIRYLFDGATLIGELAQNHPDAGRPEALIARYFTGARPDDRLRMDRRVDDKPNGTFAAYFLHTGLQGNLKIYTDRFQQPWGIYNKQPPPGSAPAAPTRPPNDRIVIRGTDTRSPYISDTVRIDTFAGLKYREDAGIPIFDYRSAPGLARKIDMAVYEEDMTKWQNRGAAILAAGVALPFAAPYAVIYYPVAIKGALLGGMLNVGMNSFAASYTNTSYTMEEAATHFARGALAGAAGGVVSALQFGILAELTLDFAVSLAMDTVIDVGWSGRGWGQAIGDNLIAAAQGAGIGFVTSRVGMGLGATASLMSAARNRGAVRAYSTIDVSQKVKVSGMKALWVDSFKQGKMKTADQKLFEKTILHELENGTVMSKRIAKLIRDGEVTVYFKEFDDPGMAGYHYLGSKAMHINTSFGFDSVSGRIRTRQVASTIVHEGIHFLGGGELSAHVGQAQFLDTRIRQSKRTGHLDQMTEKDVPYFHPFYMKLVNAYRRDVVDLIMHIRNYGYSSPNRIYLPRNIRPHQWVIDNGGFSRLLGEQSGILDVLENQANAGHRGMP